MSFYTAAISDIHSNGVTFTRRLSIVKIESSPPSFASRINHQKLNTSEENVRMRSWLAGRILSYGNLNRDDGDRIIPWLMWPTILVLRQFTSFRNIVCLKKIQPNVESSSKRTQSKFIVVLKGKNMLGAYLMNRSIFLFLIPLNVMILHIDGC